MNRHRALVRWTALVLMLAWTIPATRVEAQRQAAGTVNGGASVPGRAASSPPSPGPLARSASREAARLARTAPARASNADSSQAPPRPCWACRHTAVLGALIGFGSGCAMGASRVGGSDDNFYNTLDELGCPIVGSIGAGAGALVGWVVSHLK